MADKRKQKQVIYFCAVVLILAVFFFQAFTFAHQLHSRVDEGSFLIKGYYFVTGRYKPFQDYGPWTNNMPLAYLIPGIPQALFGPGLVVGRYFAIFCALLMLIGLWILTNRLFGRWWALIPVASFALSPGWIATNVQAVSQVLVACQVTWMLVFLIGEDRKDWQLSAAALLSVSATLTRQNMVFLMAFVVLYTWWQFGFRKALLTFAFAAVPFIIVHLVYYPRIMELWFKWLPSSIKNMFNIGFITGGGKQVWRPGGDRVDRISSFFITYRYYFFSLLGTIFAIPLLFKRDNWRSKHEWKTVISLVLIFFMMLLLHAWASLTKNYCIFCFSNYVDFFLPIGALITVYMLYVVYHKQGKVPLLYQLPFLAVFIPGIFFGSMDTVGRAILALAVPRIKSGRLAGGTTALWEVLRNAFGLAYDQALFTIPPIVGLLSFLTFFLIVVILYRVVRSKKRGFSSLFLLILFATVLVLTPSDLLGGYPDENPCNGDVLANYGSAGASLLAQIPDGASIYWGSGSVVTPLLYIADRQVEPLQLNGIYPKRDGGNRDELERNGYYNQESVRDWRENADYILVQHINMGEFWGEYLDPALFDELTPTVPIDPCEPLSVIKIFRRK